MISVEQAERNVLRCAKLFSSEFCQIDKALGMVLRETIRSDRDQPPFDKSVVDGIAIPFAAWERDIRSFVIEGVQPAGRKPSKINCHDGCVEIMTGAVVPKRLDAIVPVERIRIEGRIATIDSDWSVQKGDYIRKKGSDTRKGKILLKSGVKIKPQHIGIIASVGKPQIKVSGVPKIAVVSTGDELVDVGRPAQYFQTRKSNSHALAAILRSAGFSGAKIFHIKDNVGQLTSQLRRLLSRYDILVLSGGVSMGKFDYVPQVLKKLKVKVLFHKVAQKPGKPFWFGRSREGKHVFALPGNPVSTQVCAYRYVLPYLAKSSGISLPNFIRANLGTDYQVKTNLTYFLPVKLKTDEFGMLLAHPAPISGSGDFSALADTDGFVEFPAGIGNFAKDTTLKVFLW